MHTKDKWTVQPFKHQIFIDSENHYIADMFKEHQSRDEQLANAERICQMNNSFDELLAVVKEVRELMKLDLLLHVNLEPQNKLEKRIVQAIAQAEKPE